MAEEVRFELTVGANPRRFSRPVHSTTLPLFRRRNFIIGWKNLEAIPLLRYRDTQIGKSHESS